jgi:alkylglycerol monooxygenase
MERYGQVLNIAMPIFLALVLFEKWYGVRKGMDTVRVMDMISSLSSGMTNVVKDVLGLSISLITYQWIVAHWAIYHIQSAIWIYVIAFISLDFLGYWNHRFAHQINFLWNKHAIHHSSEEFNLACALRQSISTFVNLFTIFLLPAALLGIPANVINVIAPLHLFAQFWYHTRHIDKMGFLEKIIVTPSHHRVHHAINPEYLDKNHGQIFIIWDKLFGTFQEELPNVPPVYGITRPAQTWNPIKINFQHLFLLIQDAWHAQSWSDKLRIWFMPTGWRPADVVANYPVSKIEDIYHFQKYDPETSPQLKTWALVQLMTTFAFIAYFFAHIGTIGSPDIFLYGLFIFITVYSYTELMDINPYSVWWEVMRVAIGLGIVVYKGGWFGLNITMTYLMVVYWVLSIIMSVKLSNRQNVTVST